MSTRMVLHGHATKDSCVLHVSQNGRALATFRGETILAAAWKAQRYLDAKIAAEAAGNEPSA